MSVSTPGAPHTHEKRKVLLRWASLFALAIIAGIFFIPKNNAFFGWRGQEPNPVIDEVYRYFDLNNASGIILTNEPLAAAYSDQLFTPLTYDEFSAEAIRRHYETLKEKEWGILYSPQGFSCPIDDRSCQETTKAVEKMISEDHKLVLERTYGTNETGIRTYQFWRKKA